MNIQYKHVVQRVAVLDPKITGGKTIQVGVVEDYKKTDNEISVNIRLNDDLPKEMEEGIHKNPNCLRIAEVLSAPQEVVIIPSRPKIIS